MDSSHSGLLHEVLSTSAAAEPQKVDSHMAEFDAQFLSPTETFDDPFPFVEHLSSEFGRSTSAILPELDLLRSDDRHVAILFGLPRLRSVSVHRLHDPSVKHLRVKGCDQNPTQCDHNRYESPDLTENAHWIHSEA